MTDNCKLRIIAEHLGMRKLGLIMLICHLYLFIVLPFVHITTAETLLMWYNG